MGCDQYSVDSFINKIGTSTIADIAIERDIPVVILGDSRKKVSNLIKNGVFFEEIKFKTGMHLVTEEDAHHF